MLFLAICRKQHTPLQSEAQCCFLCEWNLTNTVNNGSEDSHTELESDRGQ